MKWLLWKLSPLINSVIPSLLGVLVPHHLHCGTTADVTIGVSHSRHVTDMATGHVPKCELEGSHISAGAKYSSRAG